MFIRKSFRNAVGEILRDHGVLGISSIHVIAGEQCVFTQIVLVGQTVLALSASGVQPGHPHPIALAETCDPSPQFIHHPDHLVPRD